MKRSHYIRIVPAGLGFLILILDGETALAGIREGIDICLWTVIPAIFPFLFISSVLTDSLYGKKMPSIRRLAQCYKIPEDAGCLLLIGYLGGYPTGAANAARIWREGGTDSETAERLAVVCNNSGPAFLFGILGSLFSQKSSVWLLWAVHIISGLLTARILPSPKMNSCKITSIAGKSIPRLLRSSTMTMATICSWILIFRMILSFGERWFFWMLPEGLCVWVSGILELSNGCLALRQIPSQELRFYLAAFLLGFGGFCVAMQTFSVCEGLKLSLYLPGKLLHGFISVLLAILTYRVGPGICLIVILIILPLILSFPRKIEKRGSNSTSGVV